MQHAVLLRGHVAEAAACPGGLISTAPHPSTASVCTHIKVSGGPRAAARRSNWSWPSRRLVSAVRWEGEGTGVGCIPVLLHC